MDLIITTFVVVALAVAVVTDLRQQRIPNALTFSTALAGLAYHFTTGGADGLLFALAGLGMGLALMLVPYLLGVMGGGDVKLMAALGACLGWQLIAEAFLYSSLAGGVYALVILLARHRDMLLRILKNFWITLWLFLASKKAEYAPVRGGEKLPRLCYGVAIAAGTCAALLRVAHDSGLISGLVSGLV
ncbi:MAG: prepilin peptidase [Desulfovibrionaceae bacterium]